MNSRNPVSILYDSSGNAVGVVQEGAVYRLQVQATIADIEGDVAHVETMGDRQAQAVSYPELLTVVVRMADQIDKVAAQLAAITGDEDPL